MTAGRSWAIPKATSSTPRTRSRTSGHPSAILSRARRCPGVGAGAAILFGLSRRRLLRDGVLDACEVPHGVHERVLELLERAQRVAVEAVCLLLRERRVRRERLHGRSWRLPGDSGVRIAGLVVARVELLTLDAAVLGDLGGRLVPLGAGKHAAGGNAAVDEADVVRAAVERDRFACQPAIRPVVGEHPLDRAGARRTGELR